MKEKSVPMLRWIIEREAGAKFAFETLDEAKRWTTANGFDTGTIRRLQPDEAVPIRKCLRDTTNWIISVSPMTHEFEDDQRDAITRDRIRNAMRNW